MIVPDINMLIYAHKPDAQSMTRPDTGGKAWFTGPKASAFPGQ